MPVLADHIGGLSTGSIVASAVSVATPVILSQLDSISGNAGWAGAGLLGAVLGWLLLWHLPAKDKQMAEKDKAKDEAIALKDKDMKELIANFRLEAKDQRSAHKEVLDKVCAEFREQIQEERNECTENFRAIAASIKEGRLHG